MPSAKSGSKLAEPGHNSLFGRIVNEVKNFRHRTHAANLFALHLADFVAQHFADFFDGPWIGAAEAGDAISNFGLFFFRQ